MVPEMNYHCEQCGNEMDELELPEEHAAKYHGECVDCGLYLFVYDEWVWYGRFRDAFEWYQK